jgi:hypothetical protein
MTPDLLNPAAGAGDQARHEEILAKVDEYSGECEEAVPFGELYTLVVDGKTYLTCTHTPPHTKLI